jgi:P-type E1-E2 ATPase
MVFVLTIVIVSSATINILSKRGMQASVIRISTYHTYVKVRRNNKWYEVPYSDLVPGDLIDIQENWILPCDLLIIKGATVCDESMLTGEEMPVQKFSCPIGNNIIYDPLNSGKKYTLFSGTNFLSSGRMLLQLDKSMPQKDQKKKEYFV